MDEMPPLSAMPWGKGGFDVGYSSTTYRKLATMSLLFLF
jgi:hypothetical protein